MLVSTCVGSFGGDSVAQLLEQDQMRSVATMIRVTGLVKCVHNHEHARD